MDLQQALAAAEYWRGEAAYHQARNVGLEATLAAIRRRQPWTLNEARQRAALAQLDLEAARELVEALAAENAELRRRVGVDELTIRVEATDAIPPGIVFAVKDHKCVGVITNIGDAPKGPR